MFPLFNIEKVFKAFLCKTVFCFKWAVEKQRVVPCMGLSLGDMPERSMHSCTVFASISKGKYPLNNVFMLLLLHQTDSHHACFIAAATIQSIP